MICPMRPSRAPNIVSVSFHRYGSTSVPISGTNRERWATPHRTKSTLPRRTISRLSRVAPSALEWWTCTSTCPRVPSATSCLNFSAERPHACSFEVGEEKRRTYLGCCARALPASTAATMKATNIRMRRIVPLQWWCWQ